MSKAYEMSATVRGFNRDKEEDIVDAWKSVWDSRGDEAEVDHLMGEDGPSVRILPTYGQLCGGETDDEFAERAAKEIREANGSYCEVEVTSAYVEEPPTETFVFDEEEFIRLCGKPEDQTVDEESQ